MDLKCNNQDVIEVIIIRIIIIIMIIIHFICIALYFSAISKCYRAENKKRLKGEHIKDT